MHKGWPPCLPPPAFAAATHHGKTFCPPILPACPRRGGDDVYADDDHHDDCGGHGHHSAELQILYFLSIAVRALRPPHPMPSPVDLPAVAPCGVLLPRS